MITADVKTIILQHLGDKFAQGEVNLFTGAGFSHACKNFRGDFIPTGWQLRQPLWELAYGGVVPNESSLADVYASAEVLQPQRTAELLTSLLSVHPPSIPEYYERVYSAPWSAAYTLNIDNLSDAVSSRFTLPRQIDSISATTGVDQLRTSRAAPRKLEMVHLNGTLNDLPHNVTFTPLQYGQRAVEHDSWYAGLVARLLSQATVFIGTKLEEGPFWQYIQLRRMRGARTRELRPRSYLVTPTLDKAKETVLRQLNILWVQADLEEFDKEILQELGPQIAIGIARIAQEGPKAKSLSEVASLATSPNRSSEFLMGAKPIWADIQSGRAIERASDHDLEQTAIARLGDPVPGVLLLTGTAGAGRSTTLMRLGLRLAALGHRVGWVDEDSDIGPFEIRAGMREADSPRILIIDDIDIYGQEGLRLAADITNSPTQPLLVFGVRSGRADRLTGEGGLRGVPLTEISVPNLEDADIDALIEVLSNNNRLGEMKGMTARERHIVFSRLAGRQLLVAMIKATSGLEHSDKAKKEFNDLAADSRHVYAMVCLASSFRFSLSKAQVIAAVGDMTGASLITLDLLISRHLIVSKPDGTVRARHRVIADLVRDELHRTGEIRSVMDGLAFVAASEVRPNIPRNDKRWRLLRAVVNHVFVYKNIPSQAQEYYVPLEPILNWDYHYWLQRGTFEVKFGSLSLAENFLGQAKSLEPDDALVLTEWAYFLFRKALEEPAGAESPGWVSDATSILEDMISARGEWDHYPYHILGQQGLLWARRGIPDPKERQTYLLNLLTHMRRGSERFPTSFEIIQTTKEVNRNYLLGAVN